jgi:acyl-coenzyme A thioesterase PaaI-like protein
MSDKFFNKTINSNDTIPRALAFMRKPGSLHDPPNISEDKDLPQCPEEPHFVAVCQLEGGLNGYINTAHGGVLSALLDETLGLCAESYRVFMAKEQGHLLTASLEVYFRSPVATPSVVIIKSWVRQNIDRKWFLEAHILDQNGSLKVEAKSLYIRLRAAL